MKYYSILFAVLILASSCKQAESGSAVATATEATTKTVSAAEKAVSSTATNAKEMLGDAVDGMKTKVGEVSEGSKEAVAEVMKEMDDMTETKSAEKGATVTEIEKKMSDVKDDMMDDKEKKMIHTEEEMNEKEMVTKETMTKKVAAPTAAVAQVAKEEKPMPEPTKEVMEKKETKPVVTGPNHDNFDAILRKHVASNGDVNYAGIKADQAALNNYLGELEAADVSTMSRKEKLAYWINAYNAYTIKLITDNYPLGSITDLEGGKPWDKKWIKLNGKTLSLNNIENDIIRPQFNEPRIHFAVNCAAKSCPPLLNRAWTAKNLEANFEKQTKAFVNSSSFNQIGGSSATVSKIFEWYAVDFGDLITFLNKYSSTKLDAGATISYKDYNWSLNKS